MASCDGPRAHRARSAFAAFTLASRASRHVHVRRPGILRAPRDHPPPPPRRPRRAPRRRGFGRARSVQLVIVTRRHRRRARLVRAVEHRRLRDIAEVKSNGVVRVRILRERRVVERGGDADDLRVRGCVVRLAPRRQLAGGWSADAEDLLGDGDGFGFFGVRGRAWRVRRRRSARRRRS